MICQVEREEHTSNAMCPKAPGQMCCDSSAGPWGACVCVGGVRTCTHMRTWDGAAEGKGLARDELDRLDQEGGLVCHAKELGVLSPKPQGAIERGFKQGSAMIRFAC